MALHDVKEILDELERLYGNEARPASDFCYEEPLDDLILTILSQNTNDKLRDKAFANMKARYSSWEEVAHADIEELKDVLRIAGMSGTKPPRIQQILAAVKDKFGVYSIKELRGWTQPDVRAYLTSLPGVGPKTSAIVECFDLDLPGFPVDTHTKAQAAQRLQPGGIVPAQAQRRRQQTDDAALGRFALGLADLKFGICAPRLQRSCQAQQQRGHHSTPFPVSAPNCCPTAASSASSTRPRGCAGASASSPSPTVNACSGASA